MADRKEKVLNHEGLKSYDKKIKEYINKKIISAQYGLQLNEEGVLCLVQIPDAQTASNNIVQED